MPLHLLFNMYFLYLAGPFVERLYGRWTFLALYLLFAARRVARRRSRSPRRRRPDRRRRVGRDLRVVRAAGRRRADPPAGPGPADAASFMGQLAGLVVINLLFGFLVCPGSTTSPTSAGSSRAWSIGVLFAPTRVPTLRSLWVRPGSDARDDGARVRGGRATARSAPRVSGSWLSRSSSCGRWAPPPGGSGCSRCSTAGGRGSPRAATSLAFLEMDVARGVAPVSQLEAATDDLVAEVVGVQVAAGLDLVTDGQVRWADPGAALLRAIGDGDTGADGLLVHAWRSTAALTDGVAAQSIAGPYSLGLRVHEGADAERRTEFTLELAARLAAELAALAAAGCPMVLVEEPAAVGIGTSGSTSTDDAERALFASAQARLLADRPALHAMLVVTGGSAWPAGARDDPRRARTSRTCST